MCHVIHVISTDLNTFALTYPKTNYRKITVKEDTFNNVTENVSKQRWTCRNKYLQKYLIQYFFLPPN